MAWLPALRSSASSAAPQPFDLLCECAVRHGGIRQETSQRIICRTCGASLFVLPRNPYPAASPLPERAPRPAANDAESATASAPAAPRFGRVSRHRRQREGDPVAQSVKDAAQMTTAAISDMAEATARGAQVALRKVGRAGGQAAEEIKRFWTPVRLTGLAILVLAAITLGWSIHSHRLELAASSLNTSVEEGRKALADGDVATAAAKLTSAVQSLDLLGRDDPHARSVRQDWREASALDGLLPEPLLDLLEEADQSVEQEARAQGPRGQGGDDKTKRPPLDQNWATRFDALYARQRWVVLETPVIRNAATPGDPHPYIAPFPVVVGPRKRAVELILDFACLDPLLISDKPRMAVLGGRVKAMRLTPQLDRWQVTFEPDSGFLWTGFDTYIRLGFPLHEFHSAEQVQRLLSEQARAAGLGGSE